jgi:sugar phosphate permease
MTLGATVVNRWFTQRRGLAMGILTASSATGQLVFLPAMAWVVEHRGWQPIVLMVAIAAALVLPLVALLLPEAPATLGLRRVGDAVDAPIEATASNSNPISIAFAALAKASARGDFWLLFFYLLHLRRKYQRLHRHALHCHVR